MTAQTFKVEIPWKEKNTFAFSLARNSPEPLGENQWHFQPELRTCKKPNQRSRTKKKSKYKTTIVIKYNWDCSCCSGNIGKQIGSKIWIPMPYYILYSLVLLTHNKTCTLDWNWIHWCVASNTTLKASFKILLVYRIVIPKLDSLRVFGHI